MKLSESRITESRDLIRKHLVKSHKDKDGDSMFVRFGELSIHLEELQQEVDSYNRALKAISSTGAQKPLLTLAEFKTIDYWLDNVDGGVVAEEADEFYGILRKLLSVTDATEKEKADISKYWDEEPDDAA